mgnify:CR=1 FL=1
MKSDGAHPHRGELRMRRIEKLRLPPGVTGLEMALVGTGALTLPETEWVDDPETGDAVLRWWKPLLRSSDG